MIVAILSFISLLLVSCSENQESQAIKSGSDGQYAMAEDDIGDDYSFDEEEQAAAPEPITGMNLTFNVDEDIDKGSVRGHIVGHPNLKVLAGIDEKGNQLFGIKDVPAGSYDLLVTAKSKDSSSTDGLMLSAGNEKRGLRLNDIKVVLDKNTHLGVLKLPAIGNLSGRATLLGASDHSGIHVYIPGTGFDATTDAQGNFLISPFVLEGINNLYYEKDGYSRGQIEHINIKGGQLTEVGDLKLILSSGSDGAIILNHGDKKTTNKRIVDVNVESSDNAVLLMISQNSHFENSIWEPIKTSFKFEMTSDNPTFFVPGKSQPLYVKFSDTNGLESPVFSDSVNISIFPEEIDLFINGGDSETKERAVSIEIPPLSNAVKLKISSSEKFEGANWIDVKSKLSYILTKNGANSIYLKFKDEHGYESKVYTREINLSLGDAYENYIIINDREELTTDNNVNLSFYPPDGATEVNISPVSGVYDEDNWMPIVDEMSFEITRLDIEGGDSATVYAIFRFADGLESDEASDGIKVDLLGNVSIACPEELLVDQDNFPITINYNAHSEQFKASYSSSFEGESWEDISDTRIFDLYKKDGEYKIHVKILSIHALQALTTSCTVEVFYTVKEIFATASAFAALKVNGSVAVWGDQGNGGEFSSSLSSSLSSGVSEIFANKGAFAALKNDGSVVTWGKADGGGDSSSVDTFLSSGVKRIYSNNTVFVALRDDNYNFSWGDSSKGGGETFTGEVKDIFSNNHAFVALLADGSGAPWGDVNRGGEKSDILASVLASGIQKVYSTFSAFAALKTDGSVVAWGNKLEGGTIPELIKDDKKLSGVQDIFSTKLAFAALKNDGSVVTWGKPDFGGANTNYGLLEEKRYLRVEGGVQTIFSTKGAFAALKNDGSVVTWGDSVGEDQGDDQGVVFKDLGANSSAVSGLLSSGVQTIFSTKGAFAALKNDGSVVTWGGAKGEIWGDDSSEVSALLSSGVEKIFSTHRAFAALKSDGSVVTWGDPLYGGDSSSVSALLSSGVQNIVSTEDSFAAQMDDKTVVSWGNSVNGGDSSNVIQILNRPKK